MLLHDVVSKKNNYSSNFFQLKMDSEKIRITSLKLIHRFNENRIKMLGISRLTIAVNSICIFTRNSKINLYTYAPTF